MKELSHFLVTEVAAYMSGKRREKFIASVRVINDSLAQGAWLKNGSRKAESGFYQGLRRSKERHPDWQVDRCLAYGYAMPPEVLDSWSHRAPLMELRWALLCSEVAAARKILDKARPLPVLTPVGLSPKVTKTLTECQLDLVLSTIRMAPILKVEWCPVREGKPVLDKRGKPVELVDFVVDWSKGLKFGRSRFAYRDCEACGKTIPSGRFVPVEVECRKNGWIGLWVGCDCAKNIFGIKDVGLAKEPVKELPL